MNSGPSPNDPANYPETRHPESQHLAARPILTTAEAADLLSVHVENLRKMVREGRIPAHRFPGGREIRFLRQELIDWVGEQPGHDRSPSVEQADASKDAP